MQSLRPCPYRQVDEDGHILCDKIKRGDREVSPNICRACPVAAIGCGHLRATLAQRASLPLTVRYGNGKTEIWDDPQPALTLVRAACAAKVTPIHSPRDCAGCPLRQPLVVTAPLEGASAAAQTAVASSQPPLGDPRPAPRRGRGVGTPVGIAVAAGDRRSSQVAQKIIQLQEWLAGHRPLRAPRAESTGVEVAAGAPPGRMRGEEKRVGWTD